MQDANDAPPPRDQELAACEAFRKKLSADCSAANVALGNCAVGLGCVDYLQGKGCTSEVEQVKKVCETTVDDAQNSSASGSDGASGAGMDASSAQQDGSGKTARPSGEKRSPFLFW